MCGIGTELKIKIGLYSALKRKDRARSRIAAMARKALILENDMDTEINHILPKNAETDLKAYFSVLGIRPTSDKERIRRAYISNAKKSHPDVNSLANAEETMKKLNEAYAALSKSDIRLNNLNNEKESVVRIENTALELYAKLRTSDYERLVGMARGASLNEFIGLVDDFCDWNKRFEKVKKAITGNLDKRLKSLQKHNERCIRELEKLDREDLKDIYALQSCINDIKDALQKGYALRSYADTAFSEAAQRIMPLEAEQKRRLLSAIH